jgi:molecular chaperone GrpE
MAAKKDEQAQSQDEDKTKPGEQAESESQPENQADGADLVDQAEQASEDESAGDEVAKLKDQLLRTMAEMENVRRRAQRDVENAHKFAVEKLLSDLLPVVDSLEKAEDAAKATDNAESMAEGIGLSLKLFIGILEKAGIALVDPLGEPFDPQLHEAMAMVPNPDAEPNSVMDVMQRGYTLNGRLVRAAKVVVVKGD